MRSAAGFHEVMMLLRSLLTMASSDDCTIADNSDGNGVEGTATLQEF
jgi:hypothetical protein